MAREFDATDDVIVTGIGNLGFAFGPGTIATIFDPVADHAASRPLLFVGASVAALYGLMKDSAERMVLQTNSATRISTTTVGQADGWAFVCVTKATGTVTPRFHIYKYATNTWVHENGSGTLANSSSPITQATIGGNTQFANNRIEIVGVWDVVLSDSQVEALAYSLMAWWVFQPRGLWLLDQALTTQNVADLSGGGANQTSLTGTTVVDGPPVFGYGQHVLLPSRVSAAVYVPRYPAINHQNPGIL